MQIRPRSLEAWKLVASPKVNPDIEPWYSIQSFLVAAAIISKFLWPDRKAEKRGEQLRAFLSVGEVSPLRNRKVRDSIEHFDERLDSWIASGKGEHFGRVYGPTGLLDFRPEDNVRTFDPDNSRLTLLGEGIDLGDVLKEIERIHSMLREEPERLRTGK